MPTVAKLPALARQAIDHLDVLQGLLDSLRPENTDLKARERAFKALLPLAEAQPDALLPHWSALAALLKSDKAFSKYPAVHLIAALVPADRQRCFDRSFSDYFALLDDEAVSVAAHVARLAGVIAQARPDLEPRITRRLLSLDQVPLRRRSARPGEELRARGLHGDLRSLKAADSDDRLRPVHAEVEEPSRGEGRQGVPQAAPTGVAAHRSLAQVPPRFKRAGARVSESWIERHARPCD